jgi:hypothetical protein
MAVAQRFSSESLVASGLATGAPFSGIPGRLITYAGTPLWQARFVQDTRPTAEMAATPFISLRLAREAVAKRPDDAEAWWTLARAERRLDMFQREVLRSRLGGLPFGIRRLEELRRVTVATALNRALALKPDLAEAHLDLAEIYSSMNLGHPDFPTHIDYFLKHLYQWAELRRAEIQRSRESDQKQLDEVDKRFDRGLEECIAHKRRTGHFTGTLTPAERKTPEEFLNRLKSSYALQGENAKPIERIQRALQHGLAEKALDVQVEGQEVLVKADLLLRTGLVNPADEKADNLPDPRLALWSAAARGDYEEIDARLRAEMAAQIQFQRAMLFRLANSSFTDQHANNLDAIGKVALAKRDECDTRILRGLFALENGDPKSAGEHFEAALKNARPPSGVPRVVGALGATSAIESISYIEAANSAPSPQFSSDLMPLARFYLRRIEEQRRK